MSSTETLELSEMGAAVIRVLQSQSTLNAALYIARNFCGRSLEDISNQFRPSLTGHTTVPEEEIERRIEFVTAQIAHDLARRELIPAGSYGNRTGL